MLPLVASSLVQRVAWSKTFPFHSPQKGFATIVLNLLESGRTPARKLDGFAIEIVVLRNRTSNAIE